LFHKSVALEERNTIRPVLDVGIIEELIGIVGCLGITLANESGFYVPSTIFIHQPISVESWKV
jgi:hypothetical protein